MAFDDATRGRLQRFVGAARALLTEEFARQLQQDSGLDPSTGDVAALDSLTHLDDRRLETARILREIVEHYLAAEMATGREGRRDVLDRVVREQAFTILNRLAALRMMEARGILIECVAKGYQSQGFQLYQRVANGALGETGEAYRCFLFSVFDTFAPDLPALFDRHAPLGRLFPREAALLAVLTEFGAPDLKPLWGEDETIGWIYQYFNSKEERQAMREARAPRSSRELAVRNQFFTPRYVVEFLVDNTLGRLWFNWTGGHTCLRDRCQYLLVKPDEQPEAAERLRDPRTIKLLDPACGSMHFGLYAFDLLLEIYRESWGWEAEHGPGSLGISTRAEAGLKPLSETYPDDAAFLRDAPRLIIEHNIYGVEIDPRAAQIASLALWLRAQRAWHDMGVKAADRPVIGRGNVVAAVPPPAEVDLRKELMAGMDQLDAELFEKTLFLLKGLPELGVLLQMERELPALVRNIYREQTDFFRGGSEQWHEIETRLRTALNEFAQAARSTYQGRLFAQDALEGMRLIDLTREQFDAVVMNPPFGASTENTKAFVTNNYPHSAGDLLAVFVERGLKMLRNGGRIGAITSRSCLYLTTMEGWRRKVLFTGAVPEVLADLGVGVMDDAMVEAAAYVLLKGDMQATSSLSCLRALVDQNKKDALRRIINGYALDRHFLVRPIVLLETPGAAFTYWVPEALIRRIYGHRSIEETLVSIRVGMQTGDDWRFTRLWWEIPPNKIFSEDDPTAYKEENSSTLHRHGWFTYTKTDQASPWHSPLLMLVRWDGVGEEYKGFVNSSGKSRARLQNQELYLKPGFSYMLRSSRLVPYIVPRGAVPTAGRAQAFGDGDDLLDALAICASNLGSACARFNGENFARPKFQAGMVQSVPGVRLPAALREEIRHKILDNLLRMKMYSSSEEPHREFFVPRYLLDNYEDPYWQKSSLLGRDTEIKLAALYGLSENDLGILELDLLEAVGAPQTAVPGDDSEDGENSESVPGSAYARFEGLISYCVGCAFGRWDVRKISEGKPEISSDPFEALPLNAPGMLIGNDGLPADQTCFPVDYPVTLPKSGILASDGTPTQRIVHSVSDILQFIADFKPIDEQELVSVLGVKDIEQYICQQSQFFGDHLKRYTNSGRKAPIYWPLSTPSGGFTLWLYYPALTDQTLYTAANDFVGPKLDETSRLATALRTSTSRSRDEERQLEQLLDLETELKELQDELLRLAPSWKPNHDDGVQITAAPLWRLFRYRPWQTVLRETWEKLAGGEYDWAHLAMSYWPDRVREKCRTDKSLAIAHNLEDLYEPPPERPPAVRRGRRRAVEAA